MKSEKLVTASKIKPKDKEKKCKTNSTHRDDTKKDVDKKPKKQKPAKQNSVHKKKSQSKPSKNIEKIKSTTNTKDHIEVTAQNDNSSNDHKKIKLKPCKNSLIKVNPVKKPRKVHTLNGDKNLKKKKNTIKKERDYLEDSEEIVIDDFAILTFKSWNDLQGSVERESLAKSVSSSRPPKSKIDCDAKNSKDSSLEKRKTSRDYERAHQKHKKIKLEHDNSNKSKSNSPSNKLPRDKDNNPKAEESKPNRKILSENNSGAKCSKSSSKVGESSTTNKRDESTSDVQNEDEDMNEGETNTDNHELHVSSTISTMSITSSTVVTIKTSTTTKSFKEDAAKLATKEQLNPGSSKMPSQTETTKTSCQAKASSKCEMRSTHPHEVPRSDEKHVGSNDGANHMPIQSIFRHFQDVNSQQEHYRCPVSDERPITSQQQERSASVSMMASSASSTSASTRPCGPIPPYVQPATVSAAAPLPPLSSNASYKYPTDKTFSDHLHNIYNSNNRQSPMSSQPHSSQTALPAPCLSNVKPAPHTNWPLLRTPQPSSSSSYQPIPPLNINSYPTPQSSLDSMAAASASQRYDQEKLKWDSLYASLAAGQHSLTGGHHTNAPPYQGAPYIPPPPPPASSQRSTNTTSAGNYHNVMQNYMVSGWQPPPILPLIPQYGNSFESRMENHTAMMARLDQHRRQLDERFFTSQHHEKTMALMSSNAAAVAAASSLSRPPPPPPHPQSQSSSVGKPLHSFMPGPPYTTQPSSYDHHHLHNMQSSRSDNLPMQQPSVAAPNASQGPQSSVLSESLMPSYYSSGNANNSLTSHPHYSPTNTSNWFLPPQAPSSSFTNSVAKNHYVPPSLSHNPSSLISNTSFDSKQNHHTASHHHERSSTSFSVIHSSGMSAASASSIEPLYRYHMISPFLMNTQPPYMTQPPMTATNRYLA